MLAEYTIGCRPQINANVLTGSQEAYIGESNHAYFGMCAQLLLTGVLGRRGVDILFYTSLTLRA